MRANPGIRIVALVIGMASPATADFFGVALPELIGPAPVYGGAQIVVPFDFGQEFDRVDNVMLMIEATTTPLVIGACETPVEPCPLQVVPVGFIARLGRTTAVVEGFRGPDAVQPPTLPQPRPRKQAGVFGRDFGDFTFDDLVDGSGSLEISWNAVATAGGATDGLSSRLPTGTILDAVLIIEGAPRREPIADCPRRARGFGRDPRHHCSNR